MKPPSMSSQEKLEAAKWAKELEWREKDLDLRREDLELRNRERRGLRWSAPLVVSLLVAGISVVGAASVASDAATSASKNTALKWQQELQDDQRKSLQGAVVGYVSALFKAIGRAQEVAATAALKHMEPTAEQYAQYDHEQRRNIQELNVAGARLFMESPDVADAFADVHRTFVSADEWIMSASRDHDLGKKWDTWTQMNDQLMGRTQIKSILEKIAPLLLRPGIAPPKTLP